MLSITYLFDIDLFTHNIIRTANNNYIGTSIYKTNISYTPNTEEIIKPT